MTPRIGAATLIAAAVLSGALASPPMSLGSAIGNSPTTPELQAVSSIPLSPDCGSLPKGPVAEELLRKYGICGYGDAERGAITPDSTVVGPCGSLSLYVHNGGGGNLHWDAEMISTLGPFVTASYAGNWTNSTRHTTGGVWRPFFGFTSDWFDPVSIHTQSGYVFGRITSAALTTWWGLVCANTSVVDSWAFVT